ncbi:MAG: hypothetical protein ACR2GO_06195 [Candidatus Limnocylindria bacterium]
MEAAAGHPLEALVVLAITTGMRQDELLALRSRDVDGSARRLAVPLPRPAPHLRDPAARRGHEPEGRQRSPRHKEVGITLDRYSHALPTLHTTAMCPP